MILSTTELYVLYIFAYFQLKYKFPKITLDVNEIISAEFSNKCYETSTIPLSETKVESYIYMNS